MSSITKLQLSSSLFSSVVLHAFLKQHFILHFLSLFVTVFSILHHSSNNIFIFYIDSFFAHILSFYATYNLYILSNPCFFLSLFIIFIWIIECYINNIYIANNIHVFIHLLSISGMHIYLFSLPISNSIQFFII